MFDALIKSQIPPELLAAANALAALYESSEIRKNLDETGNSGIISNRHGHYLIQSVVIRLTEEQLRAIVAAEKAAAAAV